MISIIIPNFNGKKLLEKNLPKIFNAAKRWGGKYEIIIVDDASSDDSVPFLKKYFSQVKLIIHKKNRRYAFTCNDGVKKAQGKIIVLLNNDVIPQEDFLRPLLFHFKDEKVFATGCKEKSLHKNKIIYAGRALGKFEKGFLVHRRAENQEKNNTLWVAGGSAAYNKTIWNQLNGFDSLYKPAYWEDIDISYRALKSGFKIIFEPKSIVFHQHETTNIKAFGNINIKISAFKNQTIFVWKNITDVDLLTKHFLWLFYHLIFTTITSKGLFLIGFLKAVWQLPEILHSRKEAIKLFKFSDKQILKNYV